MEKKGTAGATAAAWQAIQEPGCTCSWKCMSQRTQHQSSASADKFNALLRGVFRSVVRNCLGGIKPSVGRQEKERKGKIRRNENELQRGENS